MSDMVVKQVRFLVESKDHTGPGLSFNMLQILKADACNNAPFARPEGLELDMTTENVADERIWTCGCSNSSDDGLQRHLSSKSFMRHQLCVIDP